MKPLVRVLAGIVALLFLPGIVYGLGMLIKGDAHNGFPLFCISGFLAVAYWRLAHYGRVA